MNTQTGEEWEPGEEWELAEIERQLAESDPSLSTMFAVFAADPSYVREYSFPAMPYSAAPPPATPSPDPPRHAMPPPPTLVRQTTPSPAPLRQGTPEQARARSEQILVWIFLATCLVGCVAMVVFMLTDLPTS